MCVSGSGCIDEIFFFIFSKYCQLCSDWNERQKTALLHLFVHPMKMGGWDSSTPLRMTKSELED